MNINGIGSLLNAASATQGTNTTAGTKAKETPQDMFMTLLVTQLKHQDPLEPQDGTQFVTQLAQFNSLDQLIGIKQSIDALVNKSGGQP
ncbi:MAG TPA: flagellar hook capping FlgD N-terminal domain-containing protein [Pyrinomonadaceae bacterium]|nr:flagellar hook capping FlgD N-terminal domain-containing protein [Pyrinomonadaceae bacterium]